MRYDYDEPEYVTRCSGWVVNFWIHLCTGSAMALAMLSLMSISNLSPKNYVAPVDPINTASTGPFFINPAIRCFKDRGQINKTQHESDERQEASRVIEKLGEVP